MNKQVGLSAACVAVLCAFGTGSALADPVTYWVTDNGSAEVTGTDRNQPTTLPHAIELAQDGDTVRLLAGTYQVPATFDANTSWLTVDRAIAIESDVGPDATVLDGNGQANRFTMTVNNADATVSGLTFRKIYSNIDYTYNRGGVLHCPNGGTVTNCVFDGCSCNFIAAVLIGGTGKVSDCSFLNCKTTDSNSMGAGIVLYSGSPHVERCLFDGCFAKQGSAFYIRSAASGAVVRDSTVVNCTGSASGRGYPGAVVMESGLVDRCIVTNNAISGGQSNYPSAGGVHQRGGTLRNSLVARNRATDGASGYVAGGVYMSGGTIESCTVCDNTLDNFSLPGQGVYVASASAQVLNSIVAFNGGYGIFEDPTNFRAAGTVANSCTYPAATGAGNLSRDPLFDLKAGCGALFGLSPCVDAGSDKQWMAGSVDVFGNPRLCGTADMGCHEFDKAKAVFGCVFQQSAKEGVMPMEVTFTALLTAVPGEVTSVIWDFGDGTTDTTGSLEVTHVYRTIGTRPVRLTVTAGGVTADYEIADCVKTGTDKTYVSESGSNEWPYATPETAARDLKAAVDALSFKSADSVGLVEILPGRYTVPATANKNTPWIRLDRAVRIYSRGGPDITFIDGGWTSGTSPVRYAFFVNNAKASLEGLTIENLYSHVDFGLHQSGAIHAPLGMVSNCVVRNTSHFYQGAVSLAAATVVDCVVTNNATRDGDTCGGVVIENGAGKILNSIIGDGTGAHGSGLRIVAANAVVSNCVIYGNANKTTSRGDFGAIEVANGLLVGCVITNNTGYKGAVLVSGGTVRNCLIAGNRCASTKLGGGGAYVTGGTLENCTLVDNVSQFITAGQGLVQVGGTVRNCIVAYNGTSHVFADTENCVKTGGTMEYTCTYPAVGGTGNMSEDPKFSDYSAKDYTLALVSPMRDRGDARPWMSVAKDLLGRDRVIGDKPEPGCYEIDPSLVPFGCDIEVVGAAIGLKPFAASFKATPVNPPGEVTAYEWEFGDGTEGAGETVTHTYETAGRFTVRLTIRCGEVSAEKSVPEIVGVGNSYAYVASEGLHVWPYDTETTAATNIQDAIDAVVLPNESARGTVYVLPGTYPVKCRPDQKAGDFMFTHKRAIDVVSTGGRDVTFIDGSGASRLYRGPFVASANAVLRGFTFRNFHTEISDKASSGVLELSAGLVRNCAFVDNSDTWAACVGVKGGAVDGCLFVNNTTSDTAAEGGAVRLVDGMVKNCRFERNSSTYGAALYVFGSSAVVSNCVIAGNTVQFANRGIGGAPVDLINGLVTHCVITGNTGRVAGGVTTFNGYAGNAALSCSPTLRNCLIADNTADGYSMTTQGAGGAYHAAGTVESCTIANNKVSREGVKGDLLAERNTATGAKYGLYNTIIWGAVAESSYADVLNESCNWKENPKFRNPALGDYRFRGGSPAQNAGTYRSWMDGATDLNGNPRILNKVVDIGCYEMPVTGMALIVR